jgi:hypothetical protein
MQFVSPEKINQSQWKQGLTLKRDIASLKKVRLMLKLLKFLEGNQNKQVEKSKA